MNLNIKYYTSFSSEEKQIWEDLIKVSTTAWLFQSIKYLQFFDDYNKNNPGHSNISFAVFNNKNEILGGIPLLYNGYNSSLESSAVPLGPFYKNDLSNLKEVERFIFDHVDNIAKSNQIKYTTIRYSMLSDHYIKNYINVGSENPLLDFGYLYSLQSNPITIENYKLKIIDLRKPIDILYSEIHQKCRNSTNKSKKQNLEFHIGNSEEFIKIYSNIKGVENIINSNNTVHFHSYEVIKNFVKLLGDSIKITYITLNKEPIAASIYVCFKNKIFYWSNGSKKEYSNLYPNNFMMWKMIEWGHENNYEFFDIGNYYEHKLSNEKEYNVGKYKSQWSNDYIIPYYGIKFY